MSQRPRELFPGRSARDLFGAELRHWRCLRELSQADLGGVTHFSADLIGRVEKAERWPQRELADSCDAALRTGGVLGRIWPWVETEHQYALAHADSGPVDADIAPARAGFGMHRVGSAGCVSRVLPHTGRTTHPARERGRTRRPAAWDGSSSLEELVSMSAHESAEFFDHPSNVGPATLDQLRSDTTRLARMFANAPRLDIFTRARSLRDQAFDLLDGRQRATETRELHFLAGASCGMLANVATDFGFYDAAMAHTRTAWLCAEEAGHNGLKGWIRNQQSLIAYHDGRPSHAAAFARRGAELTPTGTIAAWLAAQEAKSTARLGNAEATRAALARATDARERVTASELDEMGGILAFPLPKQHYYGAEAYLGIGDHDAAITEADACLTGYAAGSDQDRAYDNMASTHVNQAQALVATDLEAARDAVRPAFGIAPELRTTSLNQRLRLLHGRLTAPAVAAAPVAIDLRAQIEHFLATPPTTLPTP